MEPLQVATGGGVSTTGGSSPTPGSPSRWIERDDNFVYEPHELVRGLNKWELPRDHLVFGDLCGLEAGKRHVLHYLEPRLEQEHDGILLTAAGNTVQILKFAPTSANESTSRAVVDRQYFFGFSGGGIGCLAVHPTKRFFAVGEKGIKPLICIYRYPSPRVVRVLRNGTEFSYSALRFSQDGEKLASVGGNPDFLLTVWDWRHEQTILRCKAFGQEVFNVQFAPNDPGFLTTSGVGHIRFWKMASTFTGLKLQGDIGKFGKSELSDIEAFCVLPDRKVLSGTERGVLLLWDGNFIKCEILTKDKQFPHKGSINVVLFEPQDQQIVTAGQDGYIKWWDFEVIDRADVVQDENYALVEVKKEVCVGEDVDIRALIRGEDHYLIHDAKGNLHRYLWQRNCIDDGFLNNDTGRITGLATSLGEHLAVSSGQDGSVRCWDYVNREIVFGNYYNSPACCVSWVPLPACFPVTINAIGAGGGEHGGSANSSQQVSRQVAVGFADGIVRVLMLDFLKRKWIRTNVFKPHHDRVNCISFSPNGELVATTSDDGTFFLFQVIENSKNSRFTKFPPEYLPYGFQQVTGKALQLTWRNDCRAICVSTDLNEAWEFALPADISTKRSGSSSDGAGNQETYELQLPRRRVGLQKRTRHASSRELEAIESQKLSTFSAQEERKVGEVVVSTDKSTSLSVMYHPLVTPPAPAPAPAPAATTSTNEEDPVANESSLLLSSGAPFTGYLFLCATKGTFVNPAVNVENPASTENSRAPRSPIAATSPSSPSKASATETPGVVSTNVTAADTVVVKEFASEPNEHARIVFMRATPSNKFLLCGLSNGKFQIRSLTQPQAFLTGEFHDGIHTSVAQVAMSFDESYVLSAGRDGQMAVSRFFAEKFEQDTRKLQSLYDSTIGEAMVLADQAFDKQKVVFDKLVAAASMAAENEAAGGGAPGGSGGTMKQDDMTIAASPFHAAAKAFALHIEQLQPKQEEKYRGVVRLLSDPENSVFLPKVVSMIDLLHAPGGGTLVGSTNAGSTEIGDADDITNKDAYTIQDAKLKLEADAKANATQAKQDRTRAVIAQMRETFRQLRQADAANPVEARLDEKEWEIDLDYGETLIQQGDAACEEVEKEFAYAMEKEELLLMKLKKFFVSNLAVELITLRAFESNLCVQSFRTLKMSPALQKRLNEIHQEMESMTNSTEKLAGGGSNGNPGNSSSNENLGNMSPALKKRNSALGMMNSTAAASKNLLTWSSTESAAEKRTSHIRKPSVLEIMQKDKPLAENFPLKEEEKKLIDSANSMIPTGITNPSSSGTTGGGASSALVSAGGTPAGSGSIHGFEARKKMRGERKRLLEQWNASKPGEDADDPRDLVAIAYAQRNMGDYKLKTSANYVVPEDQRVNATKKKRQIALLEEKIYDVKLNFNAKVLELREIKSNLIQELKEDQYRIVLLTKASEQIEKAIPKHLKATLLSGSAAIAPPTTEDSALQRILQSQLDPQMDTDEWPEQRERVTNQDTQQFLSQKKVFKGSSTTDLNVNAAGTSSTTSTSNQPTTSSTVSSTTKSTSAKQPDPRAPATQAPPPPANSNQDDQLLVAHEPPKEFCLRHLFLDDLSNAALYERIKDQLTTTTSNANNNAKPTVQQHRNLDQEALVLQYFRMKEEIKKLLAKRHEMTSEFDAAVYDLRREKMKLDVIFKKSELRLCTLMSELALLEQFESKENVLSNKLEKNKNEKAQIVAEIQELQESVATKRKDLEELSKKEKQIQAEFIAMVGNTHPAILALQKIFKKRLKRPKKRTNALLASASALVGGGKGKDGSGAGGGAAGGANGAAGGNSGDPKDDEKDRAEERDEDEDEEDDDEEDHDDDDDDDDDDEEDVCPAQCDLALYEKVLALRERKADVDDVVNELNRNLEELKRGNERLTGKQRQIDKELQAAESDIQAFQSEKQMRFNQLDVVLPLSKNQLCCLQERGLNPTPSPVPGSPTSPSSPMNHDHDSPTRHFNSLSTTSAILNSHQQDHTGGTGEDLNMELPENASNCLVFQLQVFEALAMRIDTLQQENRRLRQQFKDLHKQQKVLDKDKKNQQDFISKLQTKCEQLQLLKFGQLIDMELMDKACDTSHFQDVQQQVKTKESEFDKQAFQIKQLSQQLQRDILKATETNTSLLNRIAELNAKQLTLEKELNQQGNLGGGSSGNGTGGATGGAGSGSLNNFFDNENEQLQKEMEERKKLIKLVKLQSREIEALKQEIGLLRGKDGKVYAPRG